MSFKPGDRVLVSGTVAKDWNPGPGWLLVSFSGYTAIVKEQDVTLVASPKSPGQRAYEAFALATDGVFMLWLDLKDEVRARWEQVAEAARS